MPYCSAVSCKSSSKKEKISFYQIPKEKQSRDAWKAAINRTTWPATIKLCSKHFEESCYDESWDMQNRLFYKNRKRKLKPDAVPTIFEHKEIPKERTTSVHRNVARERDEEGDLLISNVSFTENRPGTREVCVKYKGIESFQRLEVLPGPVSNLKLIDFNNLEPVVIFNEDSWTIPITVQLVDDLGYPCKEANIKMTLAKEGNIKIPSISVRTDNKGQAVFNNFTLSALSPGLYEIYPKASIGKSTVTGPYITVHVQADPHKALSVVTEPLLTDSVTAGDLLPEIVAYVLAEDKNPMTTAKTKDICLTLNCDTSSVFTKSKQIVYYPSKEYAEGDLKHYFYFRNIAAPENTGQYYLSVKYNTTKKNLFLLSKAVSLLVNPGIPRKLVPVANGKVTDLPTPTVSNTNKLASRILVKNVKLQLMDSYNNKCGNYLKCKIRVFIESTVNDVPSLNSGQKELYYPVQDGEVTIETITVPVGTKGINGKEYKLVFQVVITNPVIQPYILPFLFYNDAQKQQEMSRLTKDRDSLVQSINTYRTFFNTTKQLVNELQVAVDETTQQRHKIVDELYSLKLKEIKPLQKIADVNNAIQQVTTLRLKLETTPRRTCKLTPAQRHPQILGKVAYLATIEDDDVAKVLSWHMAGDMDCIVTMTTEKAKQVYKESRGTQQVLPLDSIFKKNLPDPNKPLPHQRLKGNWKPKGNPIYAKKLLQYTVDKNNCDVVFGMLIGDTIIIDDLDSANDYRFQVVKFTYCPTILTRTGDRLRSNGKFGGLMNKAPALERLHSAVFSAPVPAELSKYTACLGLLHNLLSTIKAYEQAQEELQEQVCEGQSEEMQSKYRECINAEKQLRVIEKNLGITPAKYDMPDPLSLSQVPQQKRTHKRQGGSVATNGSPSKKTKSGTKISSRSSRGNR